MGASLVGGGMEFETENLPFVLVDVVRDKSSGQMELPRMVESPGRQAEGFKGFVTVE